ncbi:hypothetical protein PVAND_013784 [Polypedilum vanderplanki]|uniref:Odorant receptor n=1 Tax=Polypedilum vanderplanki TaxID=319348 RepID=A0A9J6CRS4_POLVA|nr:hypothetical protein PVAND_013784 [Polypedilum vanderplanki]
MEGFYKFLIGPINTKKPYEAIGFQVKILKFFGMWEPENLGENSKILYKIWSFFCRGFFLHIYTITQLLYFKDVDDIAKAADGIFIVMTQIAMLFKLERLYMNRHRVKACAKMLENEIFEPKDIDEENVMKPVMFNCLRFCLLLLTPSVLTCHLWTIVPFFEEKIRFPIATWYPFSTQNTFVFIIIYFYQYVGIHVSAVVNTAQDTIISAFIAQTNGQIQRLGIRMSKIGNDFEFGDDSVEAKEICQEQVRDCIKLHKAILDFNKNLQDIFRASVFAQLMAAVIIICMILFLATTQEQTLVSLSSFVSYFNAMTIQILLFCWIGNELIYSSKDLTYQAFKSNFMSFKKTNSKDILFLMQRTSTDVKFMAGIIFRVELSLQTFLDIMKASYSYFSVIRTVG